MGTTALVHFNHSEDGNLTTWPDMRTAEWKPNYGDMLVCAAIIRTLTLDRTVRVGFGEPLPGPVDRAIVRGSTYLHNGFNFAKANRTLDAIDAPLTIVGLGAQHPAQEVDFLDGHQGAKAFIARLNEKARTISVRGAFTAAVVERLGGRDIRVTGCPSLFFSRSCPEVRLPEMLERPERRLGVSLHTGLTSNIFCNAPKRARRRHAQAIRHAMDNAATVMLFEQGVPREFLVADRDAPWEERVAAARETAELIFAGEHGISEYDLIARMVSVKSIEEWLAKVRDLDAIIGFRFHGNMVALLQGLPCFYYVYDSRLKEFCDLYGLPMQFVSGEFRDPVRAMLDHDWDAANAKMRAAYGATRAFFEENGFEVTYTG